MLLPECLLDVLLHYIQSHPWQSHMNQPHTSQLSSDSPGHTWWYTTHTNKEGCQLGTVYYLMLHCNAYELPWKISLDLRLPLLDCWHQSSTDVISTRMGNLGRGPVICPPFSFSLSVFLIGDLTATRPSSCGCICS